MFKRHRIRDVMDSYQAKSRSNTLKKLSVEWGIPMATIGKLRNMEVDPQVTTVEKIAIGAGVDMNYFFDNEGWPSNGRQNPELDRYKAAINRIAMQLNIEASVLLSEQYKLPERLSDIVSSPEETYLQSSKPQLFEQLIQTQRELIEAQRELLETKSEIEQLKKESVRDLGAIAG